MNIELLSSFFVAVWRPTSNYKNSKFKECEWDTLKFVNSITIFKALTCNSVARYTVVPFNSRRSSSVNQSGFPNVVGSISRYLNIIFCNNLIPLTSIDMHIPSKNNPTHTILTASKKNSSEGVQWSETKSSRTCHLLPLPQTLHYTQGSI